jgi:hypothetical protein
MKWRTAAALLIVLVACAKVDRPEGVVERWLRAINQGEIGEPEEYASPALSDEILADRKEPDGLEVIEVGRGEETGDRARVPYRVERAEGTKLKGVAELESSGGEWRVVALRPAEPSLPVPTEGGDRIGKASFLAWVATFGTALALVAITLALMSLVKRTTKAA